MKIFSAVFVITLAVIICLTQVRAQTPTELVQGAKGMSPLAYYELSLEASRLFEARDYVAAAAAYERLTKSYAFNGENWHSLGRSLYETKRFKEAAISFQKAYELGTPLPAGQLLTAGYTALAFAKANEPEAALDWLERAIVNHNYSGVNYPSILRDEAFANLRQNPRFLKLAAPVVGDTVSRVEGWTIDLDYLLVQIRRFNPEYNKPRIKEKIETAATRLREQIPRLGDVQIAVEMQKMTAMLTSSHTEVFLHSQPERFKFPEPLPVNVWFFPEGLFVVDAEDEFKFLVGSRLTAIDDTPVEQAIEKLQPLILTEGEPTRLILTRFLILPHVLHAVGVAREPNRVKLSVVDRDNKPKTIEIGSKANHQWRDNLMPSPFADAAAPLPLYMTRPKDLYWFEHLPKDKAVYVRLTRMRNKPDETIRAFGLRLRQFLDKQTETRNLIVDIRGNQGGFPFLHHELLRTIIGFDAKEGNRVFALTDRAVASAGTVFSLELEHLTNAMFIGEPGNGQPRLNGDPINFRLPYSGVQVMISSTIWNISGPYDRRRWIAPDAPVAQSSADYFANRDPAMDAVYNIIRKDNQPRKP